MTRAGEWARIRPRFDELAELDEKARDERLAELARSDPELAGAVRRLLEADREAGGMALPRLSLREAPAADPFLGRRLGNWTIEHPLGRGGMGSVYLGRRADQAFEKAVAIKVLRLALEGAGFRERFARERRILAALDHPGIARLLDGGESDGVPYLVLELVEGSDLIRYARERRLGTRERLRLFRRVLDAVDSAHRRLVVHRDLKPSNILVSADGEPKLLDFGIARLLVDVDGPGTAATRTGEALLTPEYASPEQWRGEPVSTSSDVFSLGVVLYELLVGTTPWVRGVGPAGDATRPAERPSTAARRAVDPAAGLAARELQGDLDALVLKAIRFEPEERYRSVEELSSEIDRYLGGRPVVARRGSTLYRAGKFARRHRAALAVSAAGLVAFTALAVSSTLRLRAERDRAERRFAETRELARSLLFDLHDSIRDLDGATGARRLLVERALGYLERLRAESADDPTLRREVVEGYLRLAELLSDRRAAAGLELAVESGEFLAKARALLEPHPEEAGAVEDRRLLVRILGATARRRFAGEIEPGERLAAARRASELAATLVRDAPRSAEDHRLLAEALRDFADQLGFAGRIDDSAVPSDRATAAAARAVELAPDDRAIALSRAEIELAAAKVRFRVGRPEEARASLAAAREILDRLYEAEPSSVELRDRLSLALAEIGSDAWQNGRAEEGVTALERSSELLAATVAADPANRQATRRLTSARTELALAMVAAGRPEQAFARHGDALDALRRARERPGAPAFLIYDEAFLAAQLGKAAAIAAGATEEPAERGRFLRRAREEYARALALRAEGERAGIASHHEPAAWEIVRRAAAELGGG